MLRILRSRGWIIALAIFATLATAHPSRAQLAVGVTVGFAPPELPVYDQPPCPGDDYLWTPGFWDWDADDDDYFWVPGTWVLAPQPGFFWTPGYWAWGGNGFVFTAGYWGPVVGFYGGIDYGFGYFGHGYEGGRWQGGHFFYNRAVTNVNVTVIHNVYETRVEENRTINRVSFNGGNGGVNARPTAQEQAASRERHVGPIATQTQHIQEARGNSAFRASVNHGAPAIAATTKPNDFRSGVVRTREGGKVNTPPPNARRENSTRTENSAPATNRAVHPQDLPSRERLPAPNTGNPRLDQKYQKQQQQLEGKQAKETQKLQQQQEKEHQQAAKRQANDAQKQHMEQRHQQQTEQLQQRHTQENQHMRQQQAPRPAPAPHPEGGRPH